MDLYIYFPPEMEIPRDDFEYDFEARLKGIGSVTGAGCGQAGCNIDLAFNDDIPMDQTLAIVKEVLTRNSAPPSTQIDFAETRLHLSDLA